MKPTKKPKLVTVKRTVVKSYISEYTCPTCHVTHVGIGPRENVLSFVCECGQVLRVDNAVAVR